MFFFQEDIVGPWLYKKCRFSSLVKVKFSSLTKFKLKLTLVKDHIFQHIQHFDGADKMLK